MDRGYWETAGASCDMDVGLVERCRAAVGWMNLDGGGTGDVLPVP